VVPFAHIVGFYGRCSGSVRICKSTEAVIVLARLTNGPCRCICEVAEPIVLLILGCWRRWGGFKVAESIVLLTLGCWRRWGGFKVAESIVLLTLGCWRRWGCFKVAESIVLLILGCWRRSGLGERAREAGFGWRDI
jgi:hypothetical protein